MLSFTADLAASQGARSYQEDAAALWPGPAASAPRFDLPAEDGKLVAVLADGMGGHAGGALASRTACSSFLDAYAHEHAPARDRLRAGLRASNHAIACEVEADRALRGMGSTLVGASFGPEGLEWVSVGDSPLYLWRRGEIARLNEDHSLAPLLDELVQAGRISQQQALADPRRHMLRWAVTGEELEHFDMAKKPLGLEAGDFVIIASDGIHSIDEPEIARIVAAYADAGPEAIAKALVRNVVGVDDPHQDNVTVIVVQPVHVEAATPPPETQEPSEVTQVPAETEVPSESTDEPRDKTA